MEADAFGSLLIFAGWCASSFLLAKYAGEHDLGFWRWLFIALFCSPIFAAFGLAIAVLNSPQEEPAREPSHLTHFSLMRSKLTTPDVPKSERTLTGTEVG